MDIKDILVLLENKYPVTLHQGIPNIKFFPDGSGIIFHDEMGNFYFTDLQELYSHLKDNEDEKQTYSGI